MRVIDEERAALPETLRGVRSKNEHKYVSTRASELKHLRMTWLNVIRDCPKQFWAKYLVAMKQASSKSGNLGTLAHDVVESYLIYDWEPGGHYWTRCANALAAARMPVQEISNLQRYLGRLTQFKSRVVDVEFEFKLPLIKDTRPAYENVEDAWPPAPRVLIYPQIVGHIDTVVRYDDETAVVIDHKTNRTAKSREDWDADLQTRGYAWGVRQLYPWAKRVGFRLGYINLGYDIDWICPEENDRELEAWFRKAWLEVLEYEEAQNFPARACSTCIFCPLKKDCDQVQGHNNSALTASIMATLGGEAIGN